MVRTQDFHSCNLGSIPRPMTKDSLAQLAEHDTFNVGVVSSSLTGDTKNKKTFFKSLVV